MTPPVSSLLSLYRFPTGRRLFCLGRVQRALGSDELEDLRAEVERAIAADQATRELEDHWHGGQARAEHAPEAMRLDVLLSRALGALDQTLAATLRAFGEDSPLGQSAAAARSGLFPKGLRHVTSMPFVERQVAISTLLRRVKAERELRRRLRRLRVQLLLDRVSELNARFAKSLQVKAPSAPTFRQVSEARQAGQERLSRIVILVAARRELCGERSEQAQPLSHALHAVFEQNAAIKRQRRRRRNVVDVDPDTGELAGAASDADGEVPAGSAEADAPAAASPMSGPLRPAADAA